MSNQNQNVIPSQEGKLVKNYWLYILKLEQGKYYVGVTSKTPEIRMQEHINGYNGANWTKRYKPLGIFDKKKLGYMSYADAQKYENKVVRKYMTKLGLNNVRGGNLSHDFILVKRFGWYIGKEDWNTVMLFVLFVLIVALLVAVVWIQKK